MKNLKVQQRVIDIVENLNNKGIEILETLMSAFNDFEEYSKNVSSERLAEIEKQNKKSAEERNKELEDQKLLRIEERSKLLSDNAALIKKIKGVETGNYDLCLKEWDAICRLHDNSAINAGPDFYRLGFLRGKRAEKAISKNKI